MSTERTPISTMDLERLEGGSFPSFEAFVGWAHIRSLEFQMSQWGPLIPRTAYGYAWPFMGVPMLDRYHAFCMN